MFGLGVQEMLVILVLGVLLFGSKLPNIGKSLGKTIVEFRKGLHGVEEEIAGATRDPEPSHAAPQPARPPERLSPAVPKFEETAGLAPAKMEEKAEPKLDAACPAPAKMEAEKAETASPVHA